MNPARVGRIIGEAAGLRVRLVNGEIVRLLLDKDFTMGGHWYVYKYVPRREVWLEEGLSQQAMACTLLHELVERTLQMKKRYSYDRAHDFANGVEAQLRTHLFRYGMGGETPLQIAGRWYARWQRTHRDKLAA